MDLISVCYGSYFFMLTNLKCSIYREERLMHTRTGKRAFFSVIHWISSILPAFFWTFLIFGFEEPYMAVLSIGAAIIHELGHISCILLRADMPNLRSVLSGFRISSKRPITYEQELLTYLSGPLANLIVFVFLSFLARALGLWVWDFAIINLATAISNLLPIEGYDGYGMLSAIVQKWDKGFTGQALLKRLSSALTFLFCILSLYLIDRMGGGYWIFGVFFISMIKCIRDDLKE